MLNEKPHLGNFHPRNVLEILLEADAVQGLGFVVDLLVQQTRRFVVDVDLKDAESLYVCTLVRE